MSSRKSSTSKAQTAPVKGLRYAERARKSIPAPMDEDSDPEFVSGLYVPEPAKKKGRGRKATAPDAVVPKKRGRRSETLARMEGPLKKRVKRAHKAEPEHNPLLEFFAYTPEPLTDESDADADAEEEEEEEEEEEDEDMSDGYDSDPRPSSPPGRKPLTPIRPPQLVNVPTSQIISGSDTEPESDVEPMRRVKPAITTARPGVTVYKTKSSAATSSQPVISGSDTVSESESDAGPSEPRKVYDGSTTEPESDDDDKGTGNDDSSPLRVAGSTLLSAAQSYKEVFGLDSQTATRVPGPVNKYLRPYQRDGVKFFFERYRKGLGAVLGDDMGLGKTLQIIAFLSAIMRKSGTPADVGRRAKYVDHLQDNEDWRRSLPPADSQWPTAMVVAPSSVVGNWAREFTKWGYFEVGVYAGAKEERDAVLRDFTYGRLDVLLTSFDSARIHIQDLNDLPFTVLIVDEAHRLKNPRSKSAEAFGSFAWKDGHNVPAHLTQLVRAGETPPKRTGPMRIALTGTAIQNNLTEFWVLLDWANPGLVGTHKQWTSLVANPLAAGQARNARGQELQRANMVKGNLHDKLLPLYFLRRTKDIIKDQLPKKSDQVVFCPLTRKQVAVYKRIVGSTAVQNMIRKDELCDCGSREKRSQCCHPWAKEDLFRYMSILISISNHLALILPAPTDTAEQTARNRALSDMAFDGHSPKYAMAKLEAEYCGKWKVLETLLAEWRSDRAAANKVLIFTKSVKLIDMLEFHLATCSYGFVKLDGSTKPADRMPLVDSFQEDPSIFVFIVSTLAGGTGLNLTAANKVVIFDPNWNPAHDLQAMDRAYRYGQTRDVSVYRLLGAGSIEELIYARQVYKQQQMLIGYEGSMQTRYFAGVSGDKQRQGELFGLKNIFTLHENESTTRMAIERASVGNLDWALENLGTARSQGQVDAKGPKWVREAEASEVKGDSEFKGLGSLLFTDAVPAIPEDSAKRILDETGIKYSHRNDALLEESHIEEARVQKVIEEERQARRRARDLAKRKAAIAQGRSVKSLPDPNWPPKRRHHKPPPTPAQKLQARQRALLDLGIVQRPQDLTEFAQKFDKRPVAEQVRILEELDDYARNHR